MPKHEGNMHGRHYTKNEREDDAQRNFNQSKGRQHFDDNEELAEHSGGHSDRHASATSDSGGRQHEFRSEKNMDDVHDNSRPQDEGHQQGASRKEGGHQPGRNQR